MNATGLPPIIGRAVSLRHFIPEDAHKVYAMSRESGLRTWLPDQTYENEEAALAVLQFLIDKCHDPGNPSVAPYVLGVSLIHSRELIGHVGLSPLNGQVEIGYAIEDRHQGNGFASEAVKAMSDWALARFALPQVLGIVASDNTASCRVLERAGFALIDESMKTLHGQLRHVRRYEKPRRAALTGFSSSGLA